MISQAVAEYLLSKIEDDIEYGRGESRRVAALAKKELQAALAQQSPLRFQFREHPAHPETREIWRLGDVVAEVQKHSQIALGLHVLAWAVALPRLYVPLCVIDMALDPAAVPRVRVAVAKARDFISDAGGSAALLLALARVSVHDDATASFWPKPGDPPLIPNPP